MAGQRDGSRRVPSCPFTRNRAVGDQGGVAADLGLGGGHLSREQIRSVAFGRAGRRLALDRMSAAARGAHG